MQKLCFIVHLNRLWYYMQRYLWEQRSTYMSLQSNKITLHNKTRTLRYLQDTELLETICTTYVPKKASVTPTGFIFLFIFQKNKFTTVLSVNNFETNLWFIWARKKTLPCLSLQTSNLILKVILEIAQILFQEHSSTMFSYLIIIFYGSRKCFVQVLFLPVS